MKVGSDTLKFAYDAEGVPLTLQIGDTYYFYLTNLQGDVIGITDSTGTTVVSYTYDAWGNPLSTTGSLASTIGTLKPLRYRGYVYDQETNMYYLQSRYYNPQTGRFLNGDAFATTGQGFTGNNMFAYCGNNPVNYQDPSGQSLISILVWLYRFLIGRISTPYGAATKYSPTDSSEYNCFAYALGETKWRDVGGAESVDSFDVNDVANVVLEDVRKTGRSIRIIDSYDAPIAVNEYRIAMRTSDRDYHFMKQHSDGTWSHKPSIFSSRLIEGVNPDAVSWDVPIYDKQLWEIWGDVVEVGIERNFYDSETVYFAVTRGWW